MKIIEQSKCTTTYDVNGVRIRLWAIVGGTLALAFDDYSSSERFNYSPKHDSSKSSWTTWTGPTTDDLDGGEDTITGFIERNLPSKLIRDKRKQEWFNRFGSNELTSKRFHDRQNRCYFYCHVRMSNWLPAVTISSKWYAGNMIECLAEYTTPKMCALHNWLETLHQLTDKTEEVLDRTWERTLDLIEEAFK